MAAMLTAMLWVGPELASAMTTTSRMASALARRPGAPCPGPPSLAIILSLKLAGTGLSSVVALADGLCARWHFLCRRYDPWAENVGAKQFTSDDCVDPRCRP